MSLSLRRRRCVWLRRAGTYCLWQPAPSFAATPCVYVCVPIPVYILYDAIARALREGGRYDRVSTPTPTLCPGLACPACTRFGLIRFGSECIRMYNSYEYAACLPVCLSACLPAASLRVALRCCGHGGDDDATGDKQDTPRLGGTGP